jgi:hypothetical protein
MGGRGEGKSVQITGDRPSRKRLRPDYVAHSSAIICRLYKVTLSYQAQVTLQLAFCLFDLVSRFLAGPPFLGARENSRGSEPAIGCPESVIFFFVASTQWFLHLVP